MKKKTTSRKNIRIHKGNIPQGKYLTPDQVNSLPKQDMVDLFGPPAGQDPGLRFNAGKVRHDLLPSWALNEVAKVFTKGAEKYAERNWEKGMKWSKVLASLKRHLNAMERGEDFDSESGLHHASHLATNALFLLEYYKIAPQFDDRQHSYLHRKRIAFDLDGVLADFDGAFKKHAGLTGDTKHWFFSYEVGKRLMKLDKRFWLNIPPLIRPEDLNVEPNLYITHRPIPSSWSEEWIEKMGYPCAPVITVNQASKAEALRDNNVDIFVEDKYDNFIELNKAGFFTYLLTQPYNKRYNVGHKRLNSLSELTR